jgi:hypothetical protein
MVRRREAGRLTRPLAVSSGLVIVPPRLPGWILAESDFLPVHPRMGFDMRQIMMLSLLAATFAAVGCNVLCGRCDCNHNQSAADAPTPGPSYPVVIHGAPAAPATVAPMPIPVAPSPEKMPEPTKPAAKEPVKEPAKANLDLPALPALPK